MQLSEILKQQVVGAEADLRGRVATEAEMQRRSAALGRVEQRVGELVADGKLTDKEMEELKGLLRGQGLSTDALEVLYAELSKDGSVQSDRGSDFRKALDASLDGAKDSLHAGDRIRTFELDHAAYLMKDRMEAATSALSLEHQTYMNVIRNIGG